MSSAAGCMEWQSCQFLYDLLQILEKRVAAMNIILPMFLPLTVFKMQHMREHLKLTAHLQGRIVDVFWRSFVFFLSQKLAVLFLGHVASPDPLLGFLCLSMHQANS